MMSDRAEEDLRSHWNDFCDCDYFDGVDTFPERMEAAGLIKLVLVTREALEDAFALERGIVSGGQMWQLTDGGRSAMEGK